jgi:hypothetical protein
MLGPVGQQPPQLAGPQARRPAGACPQRPDAAQRLAAVPGAGGEAQGVAALQLQARRRHRDQAPRRRQRQGRAGHGGGLGGLAPAAEAAGRGDSQRQPTASSQLAAPALQLEGRILQPLQGKARHEQGGGRQPGRQTAVEVPDQRPVAAFGQGVAGQQLRAEIQLANPQVGPLVSQGLAEQAGAGAQVGAGARQQGQLTAEMGQPPGHPPLQPGLFGITVGPAAEALAHPGAEAFAVVGGLPWWADRRGGPHVSGLGLGGAGGLDGRGGHGRRCGPRRRWAGGWGSAGGGAAIARPCPGAHAHGGI